MKIIFVSNIFYPHIRGGYEIGCSELAIEYAQMGHSVIVATSETNSEHRPLKLSNPKLDQLDIRRIFLPVNYYDDSINSHFQFNLIYHYDKQLAFGGYIQSNCIALKRLAEQEKPDLIWIFNPLGLGPLGIVDTALSIPKTKVMIHIMDHLDGVIRDYNQLFNLTAKWKYLKRQLTAISCSEKIIISSNCIGKYQNNHLVYNWISQTSQSLSDEGLMMTNENLDQENCSTENKSNIFKIVYFGQVSPEKGVNSILKLGMMISRSTFYGKIKIEVYGKGEKMYIDYLIQQLKNDQKLAHTFILQGFLFKEELLNKLKEFDLALFPLSDQEPFAFAPLEAMTQGVPIMITSQAGVAELLTDGYDAIFIKDRNDIKNIYLTIIDLINHRNRLKKISDNGLSTLKEKCDFNLITIPKLNQIIESIPLNEGYSFDYILSVCKILQYPYFETISSSNLISLRYKFIDKIVNQISRVPLIAKIFKFFVQKILDIYQK